MNSKEALQRILSGEDPLTLLREATFDSSEYKTKKGSEPVGSSKWVFDIGGSFFSFDGDYATAQQQASKKADELNYKGPIKLKPSA